MQGLFKALVANRWLILAMAFAVGVAGWLNLQQLAIDAVPDISPKQVMILTEANGMGPLEVEHLVTIPIETQMAGLPLLKDVRSKSSFGLSAVYVTFDDSKDVQTARGEIFERLQAAQQNMPPGVGTPTEGPFSTGLGEILEFELRGPGYTPMQLYNILQFQIVPQLRLVPGIVDVNIYGGELQTYEVQVSPEQLRAQGLSMTQLFDAIQANNSAQGGGYIARNDDQEIVRGLALASNEADIANIVLKTGPGGVPVTVANVAQVKLAPKARLGAVTHDGVGETLLGVADMQFGLNASEVLGPLKARIANLQKTMPPGVNIATFYDRSDLIGRAIHTVTHNLVEGALLVIGILLLMLGNIRAGLIVATVIPLSMLMAFVGMRAFGISGNLMSLGAIDFGLIVDGAVVLVENVLRRQSEAGDGVRGVKQIVPGAAAEVARPVIFSVAIITLVYVPVLSLQGIEGKTFKPMALTVMLALAASLVVTMLVVPALSAAFLSAKAAEHDTFLVRWARRGYTPVLNLTARHPWLTAGLAAALFAGSIVLGLQLGGEFIPELAEGTIVVTSNKLPSINLAASLRTVTEIEKVLKTFPEVVSVVSQTGSAATPTDPMGVQSTDTYVTLKPQGQWTTADTQQGIRAAIEEKVKAAIPGVSFEFSQPIQMRMADLLQGVRSDVALAFYGDDLDTLKQLSDKAVQVVSAIKGASNVRAEDQSGLPAMTVRVDRSKLARYGINAADVLAVVSAVGGHTVGTVYGEGTRETPIVVRLSPESRADAGRLRELPIGMANGQSITLADVADVSVADGPAQIMRDKLQRRVNVDIGVDGRDIRSFVAQAQTTVAGAIKLPPGYQLEWSGTFQNLQSATSRLLLVVPGVLLVIYFLLYLNFNSLRLAALIFLNVPMAATGGIVALVLRGMPFSVTAGIGFISTFGIAILDGVVLASYIQEERATGKSPAAAAHDAAEKRLRPVLTTALVASIGFVPMAMSTSVGAEVQRPLATVVIGGLITATLLTLLVLPSLYPKIMPDAPRSARRRSVANAERETHAAE